MCCAGIIAAHAQLALHITAKPKVSCGVVEAGDNGGIKNPVATEVPVRKIKTCTAPQTSDQCGARALARFLHNTCECCALIHPCDAFRLQKILCTLGVSIPNSSHRQGECSQPLYITIDGITFITLPKFLACVVQRESQHKKLVQSMYSQEDGPGGRNTPTGSD